MMKRHVFQHGLEGVLIGGWGWVGREEREEGRAGGWKGGRVEDGKGERAGGWKAG